MSFDEDRFGRKVETSQYMRDVSGSDNITSHDDGEWTTSIFEDIHTTTRSQEVFDAICKDHPKARGMILGGVMGVRIPCEEVKS